MPRTTTLRIITGILLLVAVLSPLRRDLFVGDETKYGQVIREMRAGGSLLVPQLNGEPYTHKPPLNFWVIYGLSFLFGGNSIWPFVLPSILATLALVWVTGRFAAELLGPPLAPWTEFFIASFVLVWGLAQTARMDNQFVLMITLGALFLWRYLERDRRGDLALAGLFFGIGALIKGPMSPILAIAIWGFESWRRRRRPRGFDAAGLLITAVVPLLWLVPAAIAGGRQYLDDLLVKQSAERAINAWTHKEPIWYYLTGSPVIHLPWFFMLVPAVIAAYKRDAEPRTRASLHFCAMWLLAVFIPFSLISSKLPVYMLPTMPPAAMMLAAFVASENEDRLSGIARAGNRILIAILMLAGVAGLVAAARLVRGPEELALAQGSAARGFFALLVLAGAGALAIDLSGRSARAARSAIAVVVALFVPLAYVVTVLMPAASEYSSTARLVRSLEAQRVDGRDVALYFTPHLWTRDMPEGLGSVRYIGSDGLRAGTLPKVLVSRSDHSGDLGGGLANYTKVDELRMIGKRFDVYRLR